jgi:hypothetical protein
MPGEKVDRRTLCRGLVATGATVLSGCVAGTDDETDSEPDHPSELDFGEVRLSSSFPIGLYESEDGELGKRVASVQYHATNTHWHCKPVHIPHGTEYELVIVANDPESEPIDLGPSGLLQVSYRFESGGDDPPFTVDIANERLTFVGQSRGTDEILFDVEHQGEIGWSSPPLEISVVDQKDVKNYC